MLRHFLNFLITGSILLIFQAFGWVTLAHELDAFERPFANQLLVAGVVGLVFTVAIWVASKLFTLLGCLTLGCGCLLFPVYMAFIGYIGFTAVERFLPGWLTLNVTEFWQIALLGLAITLLRIPSPEAIISYSRSSNSRLTTR